MKCAGDAKSRCGGTGTLTVYRKSSKAATSDAAKPTKADAAFKSPDKKWDALGCYSMFGARCQPRRS